MRSGVHTDGHGTAVTFVPERDGLLPFVDEEAASFLCFELQKRGCDVMIGAELAGTPDDATGLACDCSVKAPSTC